MKEMHEEKGYAITRLCELAGIARSAYYKWLKWTPSTRELENLALAKEVKRRYDKRNGILGYRQMRIQLNRKLKKSYNRKRYYRIMQALELRAVIRKKRPNYVKAPAFHIAENVMNRKFQAEAPNQKWCTDVTELKYGNGRKAYLSAIIDGYDNSVVSWVLSHSNNNELVMNTVKKAYKRNPNATPLLHSDRGFQYTSLEYKQLQKRYKFRTSMSRVSRCLDNQPIERFWGTFKAERFYLEKYDTYDDLLRSVQTYMRYYNNDRYTERLNGLSPNEYRRAA
ncbi:IS3 family transposase [Paenibacillus peoriae]|uniref:IS3 family transposase n=1 Tax=Paenibacillus TaxID=44249 RepID=UPI00026C5DBB|nr:MULTISPECIES: IS3 family transposase [Paenibacillus]MEC0184886.1 IS3 family transposase [Paenibacillus peoriae]